MEAPVNNGNLYHSQNFRPKDNGHVPTELYLKTLKKRFEVADRDNKGGLTFEEWCNSGLRGIIQDGTLSKHDFEQYFMRIDANSDEVITWDELCQYLIQESTTSKLVNDSDSCMSFVKIFQGQFERGAMHREICNYCAICEKTEEFITLSTDSIHFWRIKDMKHTRCITEPGSFMGFIKFELQGIFIVVTSTRRMLFFDLATLMQYPIEINASPPRSVIKSMSIKAADQAIGTLSSSNIPLFNIPTALHAYDKCDSDMHFFIGDDIGMIETYYISAPKRRQASDFSVTRVAYHRMHNKLVSCIGSVSYKNLYASSSYDGTIAVWSYEPLTNNISIMMRMTDKIPITNFYFNTKQRVFISCNSSRDAWVWSFATGKKVSKLSGHTNPVIFANEVHGTAGENYILTVSCKKEFFLWDAVNYRPLKTWSDPSVQTPSNEFGTAAIDGKGNGFYAVSSVPVHWTEDVVAWINAPVNTTSCHKVIGTDFSAIFSQIITVDAIGNFTVWNMKNGSTMVQKLEKWTSDTKDVAAAVIDTLGRRVLIGTIEGDIGVWNFNNAALIQKLDTRASFSPVTVIRTAMINKRSITIRVQADSTVSGFIEYDRGEFDFLRDYNSGTSEVTDIVITSSGFVGSFIDGYLQFWKMEASTPLYKAHIQTDSCECMGFMSPYLFCADSRGNLFIYVTPRLILQETIVNAHQIYVKNFIVAIECDPERSLVYTADSLGYIKKWSLKTAPRVTLAPITFIRGSNKEISILKLIENGRFLLSTSHDLCTRMWDTEEMKLVGHFSEKSRWDIDDPSTWVGDSPFEIDTNHTNRVDRLQRGLSTLSSKSLKGLKSMRSMLGMKSMRSLKDILLLADPNEFKKNVAKEDKKKEEESSHVDLEKFTRMISEYTVMHEQDANIEKMLDHKTETLIAKSKEIKGEHVTQVEADHLLDKFDELLNPAEKRKDMGSRLRVMKLIKPLAVPPLRQSKRKK